MVMDIFMIYFTLGGILLVGTIFLNKNILPGYIYEMN